MTCPQLMEVAHLRLYRENPFRVAGLGTTATNKEIGRQAEKLKQYEELGYGQSANTTAFALVPPPTTDEIREAMQRLKEPEKRIIDEFFWFWPLEGPAGSGDAGLAAIQGGDVAGALELWVQEEGDPVRGSIAAHNVAITQHLYALDRTLEQIAGGQAEEDLESYWQNAIARWNRVAESDPVWDYLKGRIATLNDPRVTTGLARRMESVLAEALMKIHAEAALKLAEKGSLEGAKQHLGYLRQIKAEEEMRERILKGALEPTKDRIKSLGKEAREKGAENAVKGQAAARVLVAQTEKADPLFALFYGRSSIPFRDHHDEIAEAIQFCANRLYEAPGQMGASLEMYRQALIYASATPLREMLQRQIENTEREIKNEAVAPLYEILNAVHEDKKGSATARFGKLKTQVVPMLRAYARTAGALPEIIDSCAVNVGWVLRAVAIDAANNEKQIELSREALNLAVTILTLSRKPDPELLKRLKADLTTMAEMEQADSTCYFCGFKPGLPHIAWTAQMFRKSENGPAETLQVKVPRCSGCESEQMRSGFQRGFQNFFANRFFLWMASIAVLFGGIWLMIVLDFFPSQGKPSGWVTVAVIVLIVIVRAIASIDPQELRARELPSPFSHPRIAELKKRGWGFSRPGTGETRL